VWVGGVRKRRDRDELTILELYDRDKKTLTFSFLAESGNFIAAHTLKIK